MSTYFIGCLHFGHENSAKYRGFTCAEEHDGLIIENWNKVISKRDKVFILGDVTMENKKHYNILSILKGYKHVVLGNHDRPQDLEELSKYADKISGFVNGYKGMFQLSHAPVHPYELMKYNNYNIHAHIHQENIHVSGYGLDQFAHRYFNADAKEIGYTPVSMSEVVERLNIRI